jgi:hypothetical protein
MGIAELHNLIAIEGFWQVVEGQFYVTDLELVDPNIGAIQKDQPQEEQGSGRGPFYPAAFAMSPQVSYQDCQYQEYSPSNIYVGVWI